MKILKGIKAKRKLNNTAKQSYKKEFNKAKTDNLREARSRGRQQIKKQARKDAERYNITKKERNLQRKQKMKSVAKRMKQMSANFDSGSLDMGTDMDFGFSSPKKTVKRKTGKKKTVPKKKYYYRKNKSGKHVRCKMPK